MPAKMAENLHTDLLAISETYVIPVSEGDTAGEIPMNIMVDIERNIENHLAAVICRYTVSTIDLAQRHRISPFFWAANRVFANTCQQQN